MRAMIGSRTNSSGKINFTLTPIIGLLLTPPRVRH
jgi:hypothetical protein